jgi:hypothetical protein
MAWSYLKNRQKKSENAFDNNVKVAVNISIIFIHPCMFSSIERKGKKKKNEKWWKQRHTKTLFDQLGLIFIAWLSRLFSFSDRNRLRFFRFNLSTKNLFSLLKFLTFNLWLRENPVNRIHYWKKKCVSVLDALIWHEFLLCRLIGFVIA